MEFECYAQKSKCILGFPIKSGTQHFLCFHSMAACGDCGLRLLLCETNYMAISYRSLYSSFFSIAYFFFSFLFCAWDHVSWTENKNGFSFAFSSSEVPRPTQDIPTRLRTKINNPATAKPTTPSSTNCDVLMHGKLSMPRCIQAASCALYAAGCRHCRRLLISFFRCSFPPLRFDLQMKKERKKKARA